MSEYSCEDAPRLFAFPTTRPGIWSVLLAVAFVLLFSAWLIYVSNVEISRPTFFSDPVHVVLILGAAAASVGGALAAIGAVLFRGERSILSFLSILLGGLVLYWAVAEIAGH